MTCSSCGSVRIFLKERLVCARCDKVALSDKAAYLIELEKNLSANLTSLDVLLKNANYDKMLLTAAGIREEAARHLLNDLRNEGHARMWVACSFLIRFLKPTPKPSDITFEEFLELSYEIIEDYNKIVSVREDRLIPTPEGLVPSEKEPIEGVPVAVAEHLKELVKSDFVDFALADSERDAFLEQMTGARELIESETLSRTLVSVYHKRLLPWIGGTESAKAFRSIALDIASLVSLTEGKAFETGSGLLAAPDELFKFFVSMIDKKHDKAATLEFFSKMNGGTWNDRFTGLGSECIVRNEKTGMYLLPYHSFVMLAQAMYTHAKGKSYGHATNLKGESMEYIIHNAMTGILETKHPQTRKELVHYTLPEGAGDIDAAGLDGKTLVIVESKSWDAPTLADLEEELRKFELTLSYVESHKTDLGFEGLTILPFFYTPFAPYPTFGQITLVPTLFSLVMVLATKFGVRKFERIEGDKSAKAFLVADKEDRLFPFDVSEALHEIPIDTYRIQDGVVDGIGDEVDVFISLNAGGVAPFSFELNESVRSKLLEQGVKRNTIIRMLYCNLTGGWVLNQLVDFKVIRAFSEVAEMDPTSALRQLNATSAEREFVFQTWGGEEGERILAFASKWRINIQLLVKKMKEKGQNPLTGMAKALELDAQNARLFQCECGEVFSIPSGAILSPDAENRTDRPRCFDCDPQLTKELERQGFGGLRLTTREMILLSAALMAKYQKEEEHTQDGS